MARDRENMRSSIVRNLVSNDTAAKVANGTKDDTTNQPRNDCARPCLNAHQSTSSGPHLCTSYSTTPAADLPHDLFLNRANALRLERLVSGHTKIIGSKGNAKYLNHTGIFHNTKRYFQPGLSKDPRRRNARFWLEKHLFIHLQYLTLDMISFSPRL